ncbi:hypothetical protein HHI36_006544 [Cryptolaemus montrouzieri]|uniref:C2H2-type domain-containing protein n=1 Tax=Cryptolaemus montrouzieri TaxID=559131 RepID=A0ABD2NXI9_9CUCU
MKKLKNILKRKKERIDLKYIGLTYTPGLSQHIDKCIENHNIMIGHKPYNYCKQFFTTLRPRVKHENKTHCIYKFNCQDCGACYIGNTEQYLHERIYQHDYYVRSNKKSTALAKHSIEHASCI